MRRQQEREQRRREQEEKRRLEEMERRRKEEEERRRAEEEKRRADREQVCVHMSSLRDLALIHTLLISSVSVFFCKLQVHVSVS